MVPVENRLLTNLTIIMKVPAAVTAFLFQRLSVAIQRCNSVKVSKGKHASKVLRYGTRK